MRVSVADGKYTVVIEDDGRVFHALRNGEPWRDLCGDNLIFSLTHEVDELRKEVKRLNSLVGYTS